MNHRGCALTIPLALSFVLGVLFCALNLARLLDASEPPTAANAIVVLGGDSDFHRAREGIELWKHGYAPIVLFSSPPGTKAQPDAPERGTRALAAELGVADDAEVFVAGAGSTYDEAKAVHAVANARDWQSLLVVTDSYHALRAGQTFRALLPSTRITLVAAPNAAYDESRWWVSADSRTLTLDEVAKLGFYWIQYGIAPF